MDLALSFKLTAGGSYAENAFYKQGSPVPLLCLGGRG